MLIQLFNQVVPLLVELVYVSFHLSNDKVCCVRIPSEVFFMPKREIRPMLTVQQALKVNILCDFVRGLMPTIYKVKLSCKKLRNGMDHGEHVTWI